MPELHFVNYVIEGAWMSRVLEQIKRSANPLRFASIAIPALLLLFVLCLSGCGGDDATEQGKDTIGPEVSTDADGSDSDVAESENTQDSVSQENTTAGDNVSETIAIVLDDQIGLLLTELGGGETQQKVDASSALGMLEKDVIGQCVMYLDLGDDDQRRGAMYFLAGGRALDTEILDEVVFKALNDSDAKVRQLALQLARRISLDGAEKLVTQLMSIAQRQDEEEQIRVAAIRLLNEHALYSDKSIPVLGDIAKSDAAANVCSAALLGLSKLEEPINALPVYIAVLKENANATVKRSAVIHLKKLGPMAESAVEILGELMLHEDAKLVEAASDALSLIGPAAIPTLIELMESEDRVVKQLAIFTIGTMGRAGRPALDTLKKFVDDEDEQTRRFARQAIKNLFGVQ
ncbi:MAG: HEAT repeat domain-containing protein [Pirellulaceae bacterium]